MPPGSTSPQTRTSPLSSASHAAPFAFGRQERPGLIPEVLERELAADQMHLEPKLTLEGVSDVAGLPAVVVAIEIRDQHGEMCPARRHAAARPCPKAAPDPLRVQRLLQRLAKPDPDDRANSRGHGQQHAFDRPLRHAGAFHEDIQNWRPFCAGTVRASTVSRGWPRWRERFARRRRLDGLGADESVTSADRGCPLNSTQSSIMDRPRSITGDVLTLCRISKIWPWSRALTSMESMDSSWISLIFCP